MITGTNVTIIHMCRMAAIAVTWLAMAGQASGQGFEVFPLRRGLLYTYQYDGHYSYHNMADLHWTRDSGVVSYFLIDSLPANDSLMSWSVMQFREMRHWYVVPGSIDTNWMISDSLQFLLSEDLLNHHELHSTSLVWTFPIINRWNDTLHVYRYSDSAQPLLSRKYNCVAIFGSYDSLLFLNDSGLCDLHWDRCEDFDDMFGADAYGSAHLIHRSLVSVEQAKTNPLEYVLISVYPNPFNPTTTIVYSLKAFSQFELKIYDLLGREIEELEHNTRPAGTYSIRFDGSHLASGVYILGLRSKGSFTTTKMMVLK